MEAADLTEGDLFRAVAESGARVLLIGRKAMAMRAKDVGDIQLLEALRRETGEPQ